MPSSFKNKTIINKEKTMKKVLLSILSIALAFTAIAPAQAQDQKVLAIIDTAIDSKVFPQVIHEVCFTTHTPTCPNGQRSMEGPGAANLSVWPRVSDSGAWHGDWMVKGALKVDPTIKIVFIRYVEITTSNTYRNDALSLIRAIDWVSKNADKYSIDALSISQSNIATSMLTQCITDKNTADSISSLVNKNIPVFVATGNHSRSDIVGWPACFSGVTGVGALTTSTSSLLERATNRGPGLDLVTFGAFEVQLGRTKGTFALAGSSGATVVAASTYLKNNTFKTFQEYLNSLPKVLINSVSYSRN